MSASVDSKPLTLTLSPLDATLMENIGVGGVMVDYMAFPITIPFACRYPLEPAWRLPRLLSAWDLLPGSPSLGHNRQADKADYISG